MTGGVGTFVAALALGHFANAAPIAPASPAAPAGGRYDGDPRSRALAFLAPTYCSARLHRPKLRGRQRAPTMGIFDFDVELRWEQMQPLSAPREFELWLDVRPSAVSTVQDRRRREEGRSLNLMGQAHSEKCSQ